MTVLGRKVLFVAGLTKEQFAVWEGKTEREITYFSSDPQPASIGVLIDVSGSVKPRVLDAARYAAARFIEQGHPANEYFIGEFSNKWSDLTDWQDSRTAAEALNKLLSAPPSSTAQPKRKPHGPGAIYDACADAIESVMRRPNRKHVLLLITDGQDSASRHTFKQIRSKILESDVQVYGIGIAEQGDPSGLDLAGQAVLDELAGASGGRAFFPEYSKDRRELNEAVEIIAVELQNQYVIGFVPTNAAGAGKWNKVKIKVKVKETPLNQLPYVSFKNLSVRSREGYFSPPAATP